MVSAGAVLHVGGGGARVPQIHLLPLQIQKLADRSDVISEVRPDPNGEAYSAPPEPLADGEGARCPSQELLHLRSRPFGRRFYGSQGLTHYRVGKPTND